MSRRDLSVVARLTGEVDILNHNGVDPVAECDTVYLLTNWAVRVTYSRPRKHVQNCRLPLATIAKVEKTGGKKRGGWYGITLNLSVCSPFRIPFSRKTSDRPRYFGALISAIAHPFSFPRTVWCPPPAWVDRLEGQSHWALLANDVCASYPPRIFVPRGVSHDLVQICSQYRTRGRLPFLSLVYPANDAPLLRSSQPKTGIKNRASSAEREFLSALCNGRHLSIVDCRPKLNAVANQFTGGGYETAANYTDCSFEFLGIPNIHKVRGCYLEMIESFQKRWKSGRAWGALALQIVAAAQLVVTKLRQNDAVLVHCTDGWDRTAQVTAMVEIIIDPIARTIDGFRHVIQKEWCDLGHMFALRNGHGPKRPPGQSAPIFAQFIDAVWQLAAVQPNAFEYNELFLAYLTFHSYAQLYGDFVGNSYRERVEAERPPSLWATLTNPQFRANFVNPAFERVEAELAPEVGPYRLSRLICTSPAFGCGLRVPLMADPPAMNPEWTNVEDIGLIPAAYDSLPMAEHDEEVAAAREGMADGPAVASDDGSSS